MAEPHLTNPGPNPSQPAPPPPTANEPHLSLPPAPLKTLLWRGWRRKCPRCGQGPLYRKWLTLHDHCSACGLTYLADRGDLLGLMILIDRVVFLIPLITIFCFIFPKASRWVYLPCGSLMVFLLIATMPNRNGMSVAFDYYLTRNDRPSSES